MDTQTLACTGDDRYPSILDRFDHKLIERGVRRAQRIVPLRSSTCREHWDFASTRRLPLYPLPQTIGSFLCIHRRSPHRLEDLRRRQSYLVSLFRKGETRFLFDVRLVALLGSDQEGLDRRRHGGARFAN